MGKKSKNLNKILHKILKLQSNLARLEFLVQHKFESASLTVEEIDNIILTDGCVKKLGKFSYKKGGVSYKTFATPEEVSEIPEEITDIVPSSKII
jgi:hypothetical protein